MRTLLTAVLATLLAACGGAPKPAYTEVPEQDLYAAIGRIPGVTKVNLTSYDGAPQGTGYNGQIVIDRSADPVAVLAHVLAILWQGMPDANYDSVRVLKDTSPTRASDVGLIRHADFEARYGPQPGSGVPPKDKPALELHD